MTETKYVYFFGGDKAEGNKGMKDLLGGKGANLAEMASIGVPVPAGFTITTDVCNIYKPAQGNLSRRGQTAGTSEPEKNRRCHG